MRKGANIVIILISVFLMILVWPVEIFTETVEHHNGGELPVEIELSGDSVVQQNFIPEYKRLKDIKIYLGGQEKYNFTVEIVDMNNKTIFSKDCLYLGQDCFYRVEVNKNVKKNNKYQLKIFFTNSEDIRPIIKVSDNRESLLENKELFIDNALVEKTGINMYAYGVSQHWLSYLIYDMFIVVGALACMEVVNRRIAKNG